MSQEYYTTNQKKFKHITKEQRVQIEILLIMGTKKSRIAKEVGIARSTLYEELRRGTVEQKTTDLMSYGLLPRSPL